MKYLRVAAYFLAVLAAVCLVGCSSGEGEAPGGEVSGGEGGEISGGEGTQEERPEHIQGIFCEGVTMDADVTYPEREAYNCYATKAPELTPEFLGELFLAEDASPRTVNPTSDPKEWPEYAGFFTIETENGGFVRWDNGNLLYAAPRMELDGKKTASIEEAVWDYAQATPINDVELPGLSREAAEALVTGIIEKLDMTGTPEIDAFVGLDHAAIEEYAARRFKEEDYAWLLDIGKLVELHDLTEDDDAYYIRMSFTLDGLPLYGDGDHRLESGGEPISVSNASLEATVVGGELVDFALEGCYSLSGAEVRTEPVIDFDTLMGKVKEKYDLLIPSSPVVFTDVFMEYLPHRVTNVDCDLRPYWVLEYGYMSADGSLKIAGAERFNAVTGEDAAYGG